MTGKKMFKVLCPVEGRGANKDKTFWRDCGRGFENHNQSLSLHLDLLPVNGKLYIREMTEDDFKRRDSGGGQASNDPPPPPLDPNPIYGNQSDIPF
jgi:hypothetical protein